MEHSATTPSKQRSIEESIESDEDILLPFLINFFAAAIPIVNGMEGTPEPLVSHVEVKKYLS